MRRRPHLETRPDVPPASSDAERWFGSLSSFDDGALPSAISALCVSTPRNVLARFLWERATL